MTWHHLLRHLRTADGHGTGQDAEHVLHTVLAALGTQIIGAERCALAAALPRRARITFASQIPLTEPATAPAFVEAIACALNTSLTTARRHTSCVLTAIADLAGDQLTDRLLTHLPRGYAPLFGRAHLTPAASQRAATDLPTRRPTTEADDGIPQAACHQPHGNTRAATVLRALRVKAHQGSIRTCPSGLPHAHRRHHAI